MNAKVIVSLSLALMGFDAGAEEFNGGPPPGNWAKVRTLSSGETIDVTLKQGDVVRGTFLRLEDAALVVNEENRERAFPKPDVREIRWFHAGRSRARNAAVAGAILFGVGFGIGYGIAPLVGDDDNMPAGERAGVGAGMGAILGGIGAAIAAAAKPEIREEVIYRS